jgi:ABC-2 type transport system permease protein
VRFLFPTISAEGRAFWIIKGAPVGLRKILWVKFCFYLVPMLILGLFLVVTTNRLLGLGPLISIVSTVTMAFLTVAITSLSIGMGVAYADFKEVDPNRAFTGFGGLLTMIYAALVVAAVILLEAFPVYRIVLAEYLQQALRGYDYALIVGCFLAALAVALFAIIQPLRTGLARITDLEI